MLVVPGAAGDIGVLARHAPLIATLRAGSTRVYIARDGEMREFATGPGFFQVQLDRAIALVDDAVLASDVDDARAREQLETAQAELERVERGESNADRWQLEQRVKHAENQLSVAGRDCVRSQSLTRLRSEVRPFALAYAASVARSHP